MQSLELFFEKFDDNPYGFSIKAINDVQDADKVIVTPQSNLEFYTADIFLQAIDEAFTAFPQIKKYTLDFKNVAYISSKGIGALIQLVTRARIENKVITVRNLKEELRSIVRILRRIYQLTEGS